MTFSKFEKYAAGKINNHASEVDVEGLWNDILPHVQKGNNRRGGLIWFFVIGLLVTAVAFYTLKESKNSGSENEITELSTAGMISEQTDSKPTKSFENETLAVPALKNENENSTEKVGQISNTQNQKSQPLENNSPANSNSKKYKAIKTEPTQSINSTAFKATSITKSEQLPIDLDDELVAPNVELLEVKNTIEVTDIIENNEAISTDPKLSKSLDDEDDLAIESLVDSLEQIIDIALNEAEDDDRTKKKFKLKYGVGLYGGYSSSFSSLKAKGENNADYLQMRLLTEEQLETIQMGFEGIALSKYGVYLNTGLQYSRIARKFSLNSSITMVDSVHGIQRIYVNNNTNDTIYIYGQVPVTTTTTYNKTTYNYFHLVDIPVLVGYTYKNENWSFGVEAGALFNISTKSKGEIMNPDNEFYDLSVDNLKWFKDKVGVSFIASVMAAYHLNDNLQIYLAPTARLESVFSTEANPIDQKHGSLGLNIGARYFIGY